MSLFKDFGKPAKDLLSKNFDAGNRKVEVASSAADTNFSAEWSAMGVGKVESVFTLPRKAQFSLESDTANLITATLKGKDLAVPGNTGKLKLTSKGSAFVGLELIKSFGGFSVDVDHSAKGTLVNASLLVQQAAFLLGGSVQLDAAKSDVNEYALGLGYTKKGSFEVAAKLSDRPSSPEPTVLLQALNVFSSRVTGAIKFTRTLSESPKSSFELGGVYKLNEGTNIGLKLDNAAQLGIYSLHQLNSQASFSHALRLNLHDINASQAYGVALKFKL